MEIINKRIGVLGNATAGLLSVDNKPFGFVIEDIPRDTKVKGKTRITAGRYPLKLKEAITPLTLRYRQRYGWFDKHIELQDVPGFSNVYIHIGNFAEDTDGCQVIGLDLTIHKGSYANKQSTKCYKAFYQKVYDALKAGEEVYYTIIDEKK